MLLLLLSEPIDIEGRWRASRPLRRDTLILPEDSVPYEKDAKYVIRAYQKFWFEEPSEYTHAGAHLTAGSIALKTNTEDEEKYKRKGYIIGLRMGEYALYFYLFPYLDSVIAYIRTKESYCSVVVGVDMRHLTKEGKGVVGMTWDPIKHIIRTPNKWDRLTIYLPKVLVPNQIDPERIWGFEFTITSTNASSDSCATFEVGPIYLK